MRKFGWESDRLISIADGHVNYYTGDFGFVFYCTCLTPLLLLYSYLLRGFSNLDY